MKNLKGEYVVLVTFVVVICISQSLKLFQIVSLERIFYICIYMKTNIHDTFSSANRHFANSLNLDSFGRDLAVFSIVGLHYSQTSSDPNVMWF